MNIFIMFALFGVIGGSLMIAKNLMEQAPMIDFIFPMIAILSGTPTLIFNEVFK